MIKIKFTFIKMSCQADLYAAEHHVVPHFMAKVLRMHCPVQFYELARKEIGALILSDEHPNIVRCFAMEEDNEFVYLALERCRQSLNDLVNSEDGPANFLDDARRPTPFCMQASLPSPTAMLSDPCGKEGDVFEEDKVPSAQDVQEQPVQGTVSIEADH